MKSINYIQYLTPFDMENDFLKSALPDMLSESRSDSLNEYSWSTAPGKTAPSRAGVEVTTSLPRPTAPCPDTSVLSSDVKVSCRYSDGILETASGDISVLICEAEATPPSVMASWMVEEEVVEVEWCLEETEVMGGLGAVTV